MIVRELPATFFNNINSCLNLNNLFYNCQNISGIAAGSKLPLVNGQNTILNINNLFYNCINLKTIPNNEFFTNFKTGIINMANCFYNCIKLDRNNSRF
jgi:hypothetical protein